MIEIPNRIVQPVDRDSIRFASVRIDKPVTRDNVTSLNQKRPYPESEPACRSRQQNIPAADSWRMDLHSPANVRHVHSNQNPQPANGAYAAPTHAAPQSGSTRNPAASNERRLQNFRIPPMENLMRKGQKTLLDPYNAGIANIRVCFGWNVSDSRCDMDASAFLLDSGGHVPDDDWFVFYGQEESPDRAVRFMHDPSKIDREILQITFNQLDRRIQKIVFVLTLNEAFEQGLNFSMVRDAYIRIIDDRTNQVLVSYKLEEYFDNVTSLTIGELYLHNGQWKFNPVGNGVHQDLAGQCHIYGVNIC